MKKIIIIILFVISYIIPVFSDEYFPPYIIRGSLKAIELKTNKKIKIRKGRYLRLINYKKNIGKWYHEVLIVNDKNKVLSSSSFKVSQIYLKREISYVLNRDYEIIDDRNNEVVIGYEGQRYIIISGTDKGRVNYLIQFVDEDGNSLNHTNLPEKSRFYRILQKDIDTDLALSSVLFLKRLKRMTSGRGDLDWYWTDCDIVTKGKIVELNKPKVEKTKIDKTKIDKTKKNEIKNVILPSDENFGLYGHLFSQRKQLRKGGYRSCKNKKDKIEKDYLAKHPAYGSLTLDQRANQIIRDARTVYADVIESSGEKNNKIKSSYLNTVNGHYIDPLVSPELISCIAYQETKGKLNPYVVNYTLCYRRMTSTAHGFGQMTLSTLEGMMNYPDGELIPLDTKYSTPYKNVNKKRNKKKYIEFIHNKMSGDVGMQLEVIIRLLSYNMKFLRGQSKNKNLSEAEILQKSVAMYDRDNQSSYVKNVVENCLPCFERNGSGSECYKTLR